MSSTNNPARIFLVFFSLEKRHEMFPVSHAGYMYICMYTYHRHILIYTHIYIFIIHMSERYNHNLLVTQW